MLALVVLDRRLHGIEGRALAATMVKGVGAGAVAAGVSWLVADAIGWSTAGEALTSLVVGGLAGVAVYVGVATVVRLDELRARTRSYRPGSVPEREVGSVPNGNAGSVPERERALHTPSPRQDR